MCARMNEMSEGCKEAVQSFLSETPNLQNHVFRNVFKCTQPSTAWISCRKPVKWTPSYSGTRCKCLFSPVRMSRRLRSVGGLLSVWGYDCPSIRTRGA